MSQDCNFSAGKSSTLVAFGANFRSFAGSPKETIEQAVNVLRHRGLKILALSRLYATPAFPEGSGPDYVNAAAVVQTNLAPQDLLQLLHAVEAEFGRERNARWSGRTLDIDLIAMGQQVFPAETLQTKWRELPLDQQMMTQPDGLILPHPRLQDRAFVLIPLRDIAPDWCHPVTGLSVTEMLAQLPAAAHKGVKPL